MCRMVSAEPSADVACHWYQLIWHELDITVFSCGNKSVMKTFIKAGSMNLPASRFRLSVAKFWFLKRTYCIFSSILLQCWTKQSQILKWWNQHMYNWALWAESSGFLDFQWWKAAAFQFSWMFCMQPQIVGILCIYYQTIYKTHCIYMEKEAQWQQIWCPRSTSIIVLNVFHI